MGSSSLFGRDAETARLDAALADAAQRGGAILVTGDAGIGKTALLDHVAAQARTGGSKVLSVTGLETESDLPYAGLHQMLHPVLGLASALPPPQRNALEVALGMQEGTRPEVFLVGLAALNLAVEVAEDKPLVLLVDDAQWLDAPTSSVLSFVARRLDSTHILLVLSLREGFGAAFRTAQLPEIQVGPLGEAASIDLLASVAPGLPEVTRRNVLNEAQGNPLALVELPRALRSQDARVRAVSAFSIPLTDRLQRAFSAQARQLPALTQSVLLLIALDDEPTLGDVLGAARVQAGVEVPIDVLQPALEASLIVITGSTLRFRHPLIRSALDQAATAVERRRAHLALAEVIEDPDRRAWHRARAAIGADEGAANDLEAAARRAQDRGATATALAAMELTAALTSDGSAKVRRLLDAAELGYEIGDPLAVDRILDSAATLDMTPLDKARMTWLREIFVEGASGGPGDVGRLVAAAREAAAQGDRHLALELLRTAALRCWWDDPGAVAKSLVLEAVEEISGGDLEPRVLDLLSLAAPIEMGSAITKRVREAGLLEHADASQLQYLASAAYAVGDIAFSMALRDRAAPMLRAQGRLGLLATLLVVRAWAGINVGRFGSAIRDADEGNRLAIETGQPIWAAMSQTARGILHALRGEKDDALNLIMDARKPLAGRTLPILLAQQEFALGLAALTDGLNSDAFEHFSQMLDRDGPAYHELTSTGAAPYIVECAVRAGKTDQARQIMAMLEALSTRTPAPVVQIGVRYGRAILAAESDADRLYRSALEGQPRWPFHHARLQMAYGRWLRRQRRIIESRPYLRTARDSFEALGVRPWADQARAELRASGERAVEPTQGTQEALSPQELQIAQMAATGLSNRDIADRLFLSHRTVGAHLYRVFPKLGIASRSELAQVLAVVEPKLVN